MTHQHDNPACGTERPLSPEQTQQTSQAGKPASRLILTQAYEQFLKAKVAIASEAGVECGTVNPLLKPHQQAIVQWMVAGGRRACFAAFGLGKTLIQLETVRLTLEIVGGRGLIVIPLNMRGDFLIDAGKLGIAAKFIRSIDEAEEPGIYLSNYETVRDGKLDPQHFTVASLDEASILRGFGGTKTFREFMRLFAADPARGVVGSKDRIGAGIERRFVATAAPSPNEYIELLAYAAYLGIMQVSEAKTRFFKRDSTKADQLTLHPHKEREFWLWVASWAIFVQRPSDLGFDNSGYDLPPLEVQWHELPSDHSTAGTGRNGQQKMFRNAALGLSDAAKEKRDSIGARIDKMVEIVGAAESDEHFLIWHDLEDERHAIKRALPEAVEVYGSQDIETKEESIQAFSNGEIQHLAGKPVMLGSGCNFQRHCHRAIFLGIGFKFNDFIQACHRIHRFLQTKPVRIDLIFTEAEREIRLALMRKWTAHEEMVSKMSALIQEYGLSHANLAAGLTRSLGVNRHETSGRTFRAINADAIEETRSMDSNSVDLIITSIPFSTQYEYTPSYNDLGHTDDDKHFFEHLSFLTPELFRVLKPGRVAAIHVKDRIVPGGITGLGFQIVSRFSDKTADHFERHGFGFLARKTIVTDVVRENNQTYRLGWTEQCKDGSRMGCGMPEYLLLFRKPPSDQSNGYADEPVVKSKKDYSRSRWQIDAHGFMRSNGNRPLMVEDLEGIPHEKIFKLFRSHSSTQVYDFEHHVKLGEALETCESCGHIHTGAKTCGTCDCTRSGGRLPVTFMLLQPASWHPDVWTDVARMRTLNMEQERKGQQMHLCPLQFDIVDRIIAQFSQPGETVFDPFAGLMTVPYCAIQQDRRGLGIELNPSYYADGVRYCQSAESKIATPMLFDFVEPYGEIPNSPTSR